MEERAENRHDPGWNDPPIFTYDKAAAIQASAIKKGTSLNKRVAYPMTGKAVTTSSAATSSVTPPILPQMKIPPIGVNASVQDANNKAIGNEESEKALSKSERLDKVLENFKSLDVFDKDDDINKRIKIMEQMWNEDKLDDIVQMKLVDLTKALCNGDLDAADRLQMSLMVDYVSQCRTWMSAIRQIINLKRNSKTI